MALKQIGEVLKTKRERLGMTLNELEKRTHIQRETLVHIEKNDFTSLNNANYVPGLIMKYAHAVNTDGKQLLKSHEAELPDTQKDVQQALVQLNDDKMVAYRNEDNDIKQLSLIIGAFVIVTIVLWAILTIMV